MLVEKPVLTNDEDAINENLKMAHEMLDSMRQGRGMYFLLDLSHEPDIKVLFAGSQTSTTDVVVGLSQAIMIVSQHDQTIGRKYLQAITDCLSAPEVWQSNKHAHDKACHNPEHSHKPTTPTKPLDPIQQKLEDTLRDITAPFRKEE